MTASELMKPRYEIIASYPGISYNVGRIIEPIKPGSSVYDCFEASASQTIRSPEKYPHLFRKMDWWEHRKVEDMPKKLICKAIPNDNEVMEIQEWDMDLLVGWLDKSNRECCSLKSFNPDFGYFPID